MTHRLVSALLAVIAPAFALAASDERAAIWAETLPPCEVANVPGVDASTMTGKVMAGYQGWFNCEGDGAGIGWRHWSKSQRRLGPGSAKVDLWPDISELGADERFATEFRHANGGIAEVFSAFKKQTVLRHFAWMREAGIDGVFVQRFAVDVVDPRGLRHVNTVLASCREGARANGRAYAVMYDLTGLGSGGMAGAMDDWRELRDHLKPAADLAYLRHRGRPLVALWGIGFSDTRRYTLAECREFIELLKRDGCSVMLGVPAHWRELKDDAAPDPALLDVLQLADIVSPWTVGRYGDLPGAENYATRLLAPDLAWCREHRLDFLPVVFPGFSWHNMHGGPPDQIPRQRGKFLWAQCANAKRAGADMLYVAMFDEVDEATAIFKCVDGPSSGASAFVPMEGLPSDFYLRLTGRAARMLRGEIPVTAVP